MAKRTLASCWKQFEKMAENFLDDEESRPDNLKKMQDLAGKANKDKIGDNALSPLFVKPFINNPICVEFCTELEEDGGVPKWQTRYVEETSRLEINPLGIIAFIRRMREIQKTDLNKDDFLASRYQSFLIELGKLPSVYLLFMLILQRVAYLLEIAHLEKRGGIIEVAEGESYHTLLWAFKEFEVFAKRTYSVNLRSDFGLYWYESDWITGR